LYRVTVEAILRATASGSTHLDEVCRLRFSPDSQVLATGTGDLKLWGQPGPNGKWRPRATVDRPDARITDVAFGRDGKLVAFVAPATITPNVWVADARPGGFSARSEPPVR
jgi:WD40 repeat protein